MQDRARRPVDPEAVVPLVTVSGCASRIEAELKRAALEDQGIRAHVASDDAGGLHPEMGMAYCGAHRLQVPEPDRDRALGFLDELDRGDHALSGPDGPLLGDTEPTVGRIVTWVALGLAALILLYRLYLSVVPLVY